MFVQAGTAHTPELCSAPGCWALIRVGQHYTYTAPNAHTAHNSDGYRHADPADCFGSPVALAMRHYEGQTPIGAATLNPDGTLT